MKGKQYGFPGREERMKVANSELFAKTNQIWNKGHFNTISKVGRVFDSAKQANHEYLCSSDYAVCGPVMPLSYWESYYFSEIKTENEISSLAEEFRECCVEEGLSLASRQALCFVLYRIIDQTYEGLLNEMLAFLLLQTLHPDLELAVSADRYDRKYGVDFIGKRSGQIVKAFQQKPEAFFAAVERYCKNGFPEWVRTSANAHYKANKAFEKSFSIPVEYISLHRGEGSGVELVNHGPFIVTMAGKGRRKSKSPV